MVYVCSFLFVCATVRIVYIELCIYIFLNTFKYIYIYTNVQLFANLFTVLVLKQKKTIHHIQFNVRNKKRAKENI